MRIALYKPPFVESKKPDCGPLNMRLADLLHLSRVWVCLGSRLIIFVMLTIIMIELMITVVMNCECQCDEDGGHTQ